MAIPPSVHFVPSNWKLIATYSWEQPCLAALRETDECLKSVRIQEALAAIEQRQLSPADDDEECELASAESGLRKLLSARL